MSAVEVIAAFAAAWNTADDAERLALLAGCCLPDAVFAAPQGQVTGIDAMSASIGQFRRAFPAADVAFGVPDGYGLFARVSWVTRWSGREGTAVSQRLRGTSRLRRARPVGPAGRTP